MCGSLIPIKISFKFVPDGAINNIPALVQHWCRPGDKPLSEQMMTLITDAYMCHSASMSKFKSRQLSFVHKHLY